MASEKIEDIDGNERWACRYCQITFVDFNGDLCQECDDKEREVLRALAEAFSSWQRIVNEPGYLCDPEWKAEEKSGHWNDAVKAMVSWRELEAKDG